MGKDAFFPCMTEQQLNLNLTNLCVTKNVLQPCQNYNKMHGTEPRINEILVITQASLAHVTSVLCKLIFLQERVIYKQPLRLCIRNNNTEVCER